MEFRIAETFTDSLSRLTGEEQKAVKTTAFDLQLNAANPGLSFHKLENAKDKNFWSVRVNRDIRLIVHRTSGSLLLCYVDHHDAAYDWAERRKIEVHPKTGAAQIVEIRERVEIVKRTQYVEVESPAPKKAPIFSAISDEELLGYGVPAEWLDEVRLATEDTLLDLNLPGEAVEALLELATGGKPKSAHTVPAGTNPFDHPDALRRFREVKNVEELERALDYPWEKWTVFLHPSQRESVEKDFGGPARISGSAGTGKTIVALHRAVFLARMNPDSRVLLTTFSGPLANALRNRLHRLIGNEPKIAERLEVHSLNEIGRRLYELNFGKPKVASPEIVRECLRDALAGAGVQKFNRQFLESEWSEIVDPWQLRTWEAYRDVPRLGRKTRLPEKQREVLWDLFTQVWKKLDEEHLVTNSSIFARLAEFYDSTDRKPFDFIVVDESQDIGIPQLRFVRAIAGGKPNGLFFTGDLGQRIFQQPFSWKSIGVDIRGRSRTLKINYRTSHQIRVCADRLLGADVSDIDGNKVERGGVTSAFNGPPPVVQELADVDAEVARVAEWISGHLANGLKPHEVGVFVRSKSQLERATKVAQSIGVPFAVLDERVETTVGTIAISTMHLAKGLEFRAVAVMACDDEVLPLQSRIEAIADQGDLEEVLNTERQLFYVACTRARDFLMVSGISPASEFLADLKG
jgi:mRNA-degrading endonuclease RelE of RelBE toxin-antitoxin system